MSDQSPNPPPTPKPGIDWNKLVIILLTGLASLVSGLHFGQSSPTPTPVPVPNIVPNDKKANPPAPAPDPVPAPGPTDPVACITVADASGRSLGSADVDPGTMIVLSSEKARHGGEHSSIQWTVEPAIQKVVSPDGSSIVIVTPATPTVINVQQAVALNNKIAIASVTVKSGKAPQPPPPTPIPGPTPTPQPIPASKRVMLSIVEDPLNRSPQTAMVLNNMAGWSKFKEAGNSWILYSAATTEPKGVAAKTVLQNAGVALPGIVVQDLDTGAVLSTIKLPGALADVGSIVNQLTGSKL